MSFTSCIHPVVKSKSELFDEIPVIEALFYDDIGDSQSEEAFGAGFDWYPSISTGGCNGEPGLDLDDFCFFTRPTLPQIGISSHGLYRRRPMGKEIGAEGNDAIAVFDVIGQQMSDTLGKIKSLGKAPVGIIVNIVRRTVGSHEPLQNLMAHAPISFGQQKGPMGLPRIAQLLELRYNNFHALIPADLGPNCGVPSPHFFHRALYPVRVVKHLESGLADGAQFSAVNGMSGIPFDFHRLSVDDPDQNAATARARLTYRFYPFFDSCLPLVFSYR